MKRKTTFATMLGLFDKAWRDNDSPWNAILQWKEDLAKHGWTDSDFDKQLDTHHNSASKSASKHKKVA